MRFNLYIKKDGWLGLFKYIIKNGVFQLKKRYSYVLEGLLNKKNCPVYPKILKRLVAKPWASQSVTLKTEPLVVSLDAKRLKDVEKAHEVSWKKWFGNGCGGKGSLAISLSRWHWLSWQHGKNMYPKEGEHGYERPPDAKALEEACLGGVVEDLDNALEAEDAERDDELDGAGGVALSQKDVALVKAALDAAGETADGDDLAALEAAATASDDDARSVAASADETGSSAMDVDAPAGAGGLTLEVASKMKCFDLKKAGDDAWALVADARDKPCKRCASALKQHYNKCSFCKYTEAAPGKRGTRVRLKRGATEQRIEEEKVKACNLVMDEATGLRPDGQTCWNCWQAVYHEVGCGKSHAVVGPDAPPFLDCHRLRRGTPYSLAVYWAKRKLDYLAKSRAAGNR